MSDNAFVSNVSWTMRFQELFKPRDFMFHDGRALRRFTVGARMQGVLAAIAVLMLVFSAYGIAQAARGAAVASGLVSPTTPAGKVAAMQAKVSAMQAHVAEIRAAAAANAKAIEARQQVLAAVLSGRVRPDQVAMLMPVPGLRAPALTDDALAPLQHAATQQTVLAAAAERLTARRYAATAARLGKLGLDPKRLIGKAGEGMGGPFVPVPAADATPEARADAQFRSLFLTWKKLDSLEHSAISIPSIHPIEEAKLEFSSYFGVRSDPFNGHAAMHEGVDLPGPVGTPVYATADGIVDRAGRDGGYGNMVEIDHGKGIQTRYGHLSKILVSTNEKVKRGQLIALMGSTGRSTGSHLHYEVRIDGRAVNPMPFLQNADYLQTLQQQAMTLQTAANTAKAPSLPATDD
jgi:murein DD-endopeptidase MepM/ murein hydrolase activator NlpD